MPKKNEAAPLYRRVIADAWHIAWVHKHLWTFGFFATFMGLGGVSEVLLGFYDNTAVSRAIGIGPLGLIPGLSTIKAVMDFSTYPFLTLTIFLVLLLACLIVFLWIVSTAIGGLVHSIGKIERGGELMFADGLKAGSTVAGPVLGVNVLAKAIIALAFFFTGANMFSLLSDGTVTSGLFYLGSYVIFTAIAVLAALTAVYATAFVVIGKKRFDKAWSEGWRLTKENWLISVEMVIILLFINIMVAVLTLFAAMIVSIPLIFLFAVAVALKAAPLMSVIMAVTAIALIAVIILIVSFMTTFQLSAWVLLWKELTSGNPTSKIVRFANRIKESVRT